MPSVSLTAAELEALHKCIYAALARGEIAAEIGEVALRSADRKVTKAYRDALCSHCGERPSRRRNGLCDRCNAYSEKYDGRLPSKETLVATGRRNIDKRFTRPRQPSPPTRPKGY